MGAVCWWGQATKHKLHFMRTCKEIYLYFPIPLYCFVLKLTNYAFSLR